MGDSRCARMSVEDRIGLLVDPGSFTEFDRALPWSPGGGRDETDCPAPRSGVVTGVGTVEGNLVAVFGHDFSVAGGSIGESEGRKLVKLYDHAIKTRTPIIGINDSVGARIQEGVVSQAVYGEIFRRNVKASGVVPQISLVMGPCAGGAAYSPALTDFIIMVDELSQMFITGPGVISAVTGERLSLEELGGGRVQTERSGNACYLADDEDDAIGYARDLMAYLASRGGHGPGATRTEAYCSPELTEGALRTSDLELDDILPTGTNESYDIREVVRRVMDDDEFLEVHEAFARNIVVGFGRVSGGVVGVVASQPIHLSGCLDIDSAEKAARFVRTCDSFDIPVVTFVDTPGFLPGADQEWNGILRRGSKLIYAYSEATVPLISVTVRKAYGAGHIALGSRYIGSDFNFVWPTGEIAVMGPNAAVEIVHRQRLKEAAAAGDDVDEVRARWIGDYEQQYCTPYAAAERGFVDEVIRPAETRARIVRALQALGSKRRESGAARHGNIPL